MTLNDALALIRVSPHTCYVYVLSRPDGRPFYVGVGTRDRIAAHEREASRNRRGGPKLQLIREIIAASQRIEYCIEGWFDNWADAAEEECRLIYALGRRDVGAGPLVNRTDGGEGATGLIMSDSAREKCRVGRLGKTQSPDARKKIGAVHRGKIMSDESRSKMSATRRGRRPSDATIEAGIKANRGRSLSLEHKAKLRAAKLGRALTAEHRQKIAASLGGKPKSPAHAANAAHASALRSPIELHGVQYPSISAAQRALRIGRRKLLRWLDTAEHGACFISHSVQS